jgi:hypothetical protein
MSFVKLECGLGKSFDFFMHFGTHRTVTIVVEVLSFSCILGCSLAGTTRSS